MKKKQSKTTITTAPAATGMAGTENPTIGATMNTTPGTLPVTNTTAADTSVATAPADEAMSSMDIADDDHVPAAQENMAVGNNAVQAAMPTTTATTPTITTTAPTSTTTTTSTMPTATIAAGTGAMIGDAPPTSGGTGTDGENFQPVALENVAGGADQQAATPANWDLVNEAWCDLNRLGKAVDAAVIVAGHELAAAQRELGDGFDAFIRTRTPWNAAEARTLIRFAGQAGLSPERLTAAVAVPLSRVLEAIAVLGQLYTAEVEAAEAHHEGDGTQAG